MRSNQNWFSCGVAFLYLVCFLFLPFYRVIVVGLNGLTLMQYNYLVAYLPLLLAIVMACAALLLDVKISMIIGGVSTLVTLLLLILGRTILLSGNALASIASSALTQSIGANITSFIPVSPGLGGLLCLLLNVAFIVLEVLLGSTPKTKQTSTIDPFDVDIF